MKLIRTEDAVGQVLCHDITQIIPGQFKGARFRKGHIVQPEDIPVLLSIGKENLYVWECMVNRKFLLACRKKVTAGESATLTNWKDKINKDELIAAYNISGIYTGRCPVCWSIQGQISGWSHPKASAP